MNVPLTKALIALVPACLLLAYSFGTLMKAKTAASSLQMVGAGSLVIVVLTHICEALHLLPWMHWGELNFPPAATMLGGLVLFGIVFALNSSMHSYLVLAYSEADRVSLSVGFYYMANACGRLLGTLLSGVLYQQAGVSASLWGAVALAAAAGIGATFLPPVTAGAVSWAGAKGG
jgi:hypothetical protein